MASYTESMDRRESPRIEISVEMEVRKNGDVFLGTCVNVSENGILIQTSKSLTLGEPVTVRLVSPGQEEIVGSGVVVRDQDLGIGKHGYAVRWDLTSNQKFALRRLIQVTATAEEQ